MYLNLFGCGKGDEIGVSISIKAVLVSHDQPLILFYMSLNDWFYNLSYRKYIQLLKRH